MPRELMTSIASGLNRLRDDVAELMDRFSEKLHSQRETTSAEKAELTSAGPEQALAGRGRSSEGGWLSPISELSEWASGLMNYPSVDMTNEADRVIVRAEVPGLSKDDVKVDLTGNRLTLSGERKDEREESREDYSYRESHYGKFHRSILLPSEVDPGKATARYRDGILTIDLPKTEAGKSRKVQITTH